MKFPWTLLCFLQLLDGIMAAFQFDLFVNSHTSSCNDIGDCETYFTPFCLREPRGTRSANDVDCPLGSTLERFDAESGTLIIDSLAAWPGGFQLFIQSYDDDTFVDDFLDNIFIEASLMPNTPRNSEISVTGVNGRVTMVVQFQVRCKIHFYGLDCLTECVGQDDNDGGHYTCNPISGARMCIPGYQTPGDFCRENINDCAVEPCQNGGTCIDLVADFMCSCPQGYDGKDCSLNVDDCVSAECPENSTCVDGLNSVTCECHPGYEGENCTNIDDCADGPCQNGGNCTDLVSDYMCSCPQGYDGKNCSLNVDDCVSAECPENSTCVDGLNSMTCECHPGYEGENCTEIQPCEPSPCHNGATCMSDDPFNFQCLCPAGYNDSLCQNVIGCLGVVCAAGLVCQDDGTGSFQCVAMITSGVDKSSAAGGPNNVMLITWSVVGVVLALILLAIILIVVFFVIKVIHKNKKSTYTTRSDKTFKKNEEGISLNPIYGSDSLRSCDSPSSSSVTYFEFQNSLYTPVSQQQGNGNHYYSTVRDSVSETQTGKEAAHDVTNEHVQNPLYEEGQGSTFISDSVPKARSGYNDYPMPLDSTTQAAHYDSIDPLPSGNLHPPKLPPPRGTSPASFTNKDSSLLMTVGKDASTAPGYNTLQHK